MKRRDFIGAALATGVATAQQGESPSPKGKDDIPTRKAKVVKVFKGPDPHPNALEATKDALWIGGQGSEIAYKVDVRIFSDANRVQTSAKGVSLYLVDERGRRFPLVRDPSVIPFDVALDPGQSVNTSLTFVAAGDARQLFLTGDTQGEPPFWVKLYFGSDDSLLHKRTLLRVL